jgi:hypothetical protein
MPDFGRGYQDFAEYVKTRVRHFRDTEIQQFVDAVIETSEKRKRRLEKGTELWRAQVGHDMDSVPGYDFSGIEVISFDVEIPYASERMQPLPNRASEGRVNPKGIPCLYCATDRYTAMTETRPWVGSFVSLAQICLRRDVTLVDCTSDDHSSRDVFLGSDGPDYELTEWNAINRAFSEPVLRNDDIAEYAPTQVLAEAFHMAGLDGIIYGSKFGTGHNVAIFEPYLGTIGRRYLFRVKGVQFEYADVTGDFEDRKKTKDIDEADIPY